MKEEAEIVPDVSNFPLFSVLCTSEVSRVTILKDFLC